MWYSDKAKVVFLANRKTGSRSVVHWFKEKFKDFRQHGPDHSWEIPEDKKDYFSFTVIRNPYERCASQYWATLGNGKHTLGFLDWIREKQFPQHPYLDAGCDKVLRFEDLPDCFYDLPFYDGRPLPHCNSTTEKTHRGGRIWRARPRKLLQSDIVLEEIRKQYKQDFAVLPYDA